MNQVHFIGFGQPLIIGSTPLSIPCAAVYSFLDNLNFVLERNAGQGVTLADTKVILVIYAHWTAQFSTNVRKEDFILVDH